MAEARRDGTSLTFRAPFQGEKQSGVEKAGDKWHGFHSLSGVEAKAELVPMWPSLFKNTDKKLNPQMNHLQTLEAKAADPKELLGILKSIIEKKNL